MQLIDDKTKQIMEECKHRAWAAGLAFDQETLEYVISNKDLISLSPKVMIPTLYDYWVNDVEVLKEQGKYKLYPANPYETVINSRPAISFYNDNNPDWMNVMIFYHVLAHIDFFQNNRLFENTWKDDFVGQALADKRLISSLRSEHGRWVDYAIEFSRGIGNMVGYFDGLAQSNFPTELQPSEKIDFYFGTFLQEIAKAADSEIYKQIARYNELLDQQADIAEGLFLAEVKTKYPEFEAKFKKGNKKSVEKSHKQDLMQFIMEHSPFLKKEENRWVKSVMTIVRNTGLYFEPQRRSKIINEGWASYWHDVLFRQDERLSKHEIAYARLNAAVTSLSKVGLNPYAIGLRLVQYVEELADKGKLSYQFQQITDLETRDSYNAQTGKGREAIFELRKHFSDFTLINTFVDQEFVDKHNLFVVGKRINQERNTYEYFIKSRKAADYKQMLIDSLYHPPVIEVVPEKTTHKVLYLSHRFENKQLIKDFIPDTMLGIEYLWGASVQLETTEIVQKEEGNFFEEEQENKYEYRRVRYTMKNKRLKKEIL